MEFQECIHRVLHAKLQGKYDKVTLWNHWNMNPNVCTFRP